jgi:hypothetical protein
MSIIAVRITYDCEACERTQEGPSSSVWTEDAHPIVIDPADASDESRYPPGWHWDKATGATFCPECWPAA